MLPSLAVVEKNEVEQPPEIWLLVLIATVNSHQELAECLALLSALCALCLMEPSHCVGDTLRHWPQSLSS